MEKEYINKFGENIKVDSKGRFVKGFKHNEKRNKEIGFNTKMWHQENKNTEEYKERIDKIRLAKLNKPRIDMIGNKFAKGNKSRNCFKKGMIPWNKGIKYSQERLEKCRETTKKFMNEDFKRKLSKIRKERIAEGKIKVLKGSKHPHWLGGKSFEPYNYKFNKEFKNLVRLRDNFCCLNCGISEQKSIILRNRALSIHHIDYNKLNTCLMNCCSLCMTCNNKANFNREYWISHFQNLLNKKYGYNYENNKLKAEEILQGTYIIG